MTDTPVTDSRTDDLEADRPEDDDRRARGETLLVQEGDIAGDYLERLLDIVDYDGDIDLDVEGDRAVVAVIGEGLQGLIGPNGVTLEALQELTRLAVQQQTGLPQPADARRRRLPGAAADGARRHRPQTRPPR